MSKKKKILWLADFTTVEVPAGGAEITDSYVIQAGKDLGYEIKVCTPSQIHSSDVSWCDVVVFSNNFEFPHTVRKRLMDTKPYIAYSHDSGRWLSIAKKHPDFFQRALASIFLSPLHRDQFKKFLTKAKNVICVPPYIPYYFYDKGEDRNRKVIYAGNIHEGKGIDDVLKFAKENPNMIIDFYYQRHSGGLLRALKERRNCNLVGFVPKEKIFKKYNQYSYFIHVPKCYEAFGRAVAEAYLCGCKVIINDRVGAFSYDWDYKAMRYNTLHADKAFWWKLQDILK